jgi:hypothetical protein
MHTHPASADISCVLFRAIFTSTFHSAINYTFGVNAIDKKTPNILSCNEEA